MGPRLFRRGNGSGRGGDRDRSLTSMGPRLFRRGNSMGFCWDTSKHRTLQWGHAFSDVEIWPLRAGPGPRSYFNGATPFQTWKFIMELLGLPTLARYFNGATPFQTWKCLLYSAVWLEKRFRLQWGHAFSDVEIGVPLSALTRLDALQWGHAFSDVEIRNGSGSNSTGDSNFNGATPFQTWKSSSSRSIWPDRSRYFNGATPFQTWKSPGRPESRARG